MLTPIPWLVALAIAPPAAASDDVSPEESAAGPCFVQLLDREKSLGGKPARIRITDADGALEVVLADDGNSPDLKAGDGMYMGATSLPCLGKVTAALLPAREGTAAENTAAEGETPLAAAEGQAVAYLAGRAVRMVYEDAALAIVPSLADRMGEEVDRSRWVRGLLPILAMGMAGAGAFAGGMAMGRRRRVDRNLAWLGADPGWRPFAAAAAPALDEGSVVWWVAPGVEPVFAEALCQALSSRAGVIWVGGDGTPAGLGGGATVWRLAGRHRGALTVVYAMRDLAVAGRPAVAVVQGTDAIEPAPPGREGASLAELARAAPGSVHAVLAEGSPAPQGRWTQVRASSQPASGWLIQSVFLLLLFLSPVAQAAEPLLASPRMRQVIEVRVTTWPPEMDVADCVVSIRSGTEIQRKPIEQAAWLDRRSSRPGLWRARFESESMRIAEVALEMERDGEAIALWRRLVRFTDPHRASLSLRVDLDGDQLRVVRTFWVPYESAPDKRISRVALGVAFGWGTLALAFVALVVRKARPQ